MRIYFMGIGGTAMGNAALLLRAAGHEVLGADGPIYPPMSNVLAEAGIQALSDYDPERLRALAPDLVVIGNAMSRGNPEVEWLLADRAIRFISLPEALREFALERRRNIVVAGTHGKTTTTSLAAFLLRENGKDTGFLIGGAPQDPPLGAWLGSPNEAFVIEGDEYDSAFFDKRSKFIHYAPRIAIFNNLEFDHADIFRDLADVQRTFSHFLRIIPANGWALLNGDDANLAALPPAPWTRTLRVGTGPGNDLQIRSFREDAAGSVFELWWRGDLWSEVRWDLPGEFNARNAAMAALAVGLELHGENPTGLDLAPLARFRGVKRRQEVLFSGAQLTVIEDFGHHPTALRETLRSLRARYPGRRLIAAFEPRSNTARVKALQADFEAALSEADCVAIGPVSRAERLAAADRFAPEEVAADLRARGRAADACGSSAEALQFVCDAMDSGSPAVAVFFSNGSFDGIMPKAAAKAAELDGLRQETCSAEKETAP
jgi:UDP-N-acetylmuramate: L-alanyl-gamma-D-glutamyl-meso-diaminopimelate ligase